MIGLPVTTETVAKWTGARCIGRRELLLHRLSIDSRTSEAGSLFVALPGERTDGHRYLAEALTPARTAALICRRYYRAHRAELRARFGSTLDNAAEHGAASDTQAGAGNAADSARALLLVRDPLRALLRLARRYLSELAPPCRIAITGSSGKTTTKELLASIIGNARDLSYSASNQNSAIGVPISILAMQRAPQYMINEVGTGWRGEIPAIADTLNPHIVIVTNIGHAHVAAFGSKAAIAREKLALAYRSSSLRVLYLRRAEQHFARRLPLRHRRSMVVVRYYDEDPFARQISYTPNDEGAVVTIAGHTVQTELHGEFQRENVFAAAVAAHHLGLSVAEIAAGIASYRPLFGRMQRIEAGSITLLLDCYNANPESTVAALAYLRQTPASGRKICILGEMKELGGMSAHFHRQVFDQALANGIDYLICIGREFAIDSVTQHAQAYYFEQIDDATRQLNALVGSGDVVLFKGSRSVGLERLAEQLQQQQQQKV